MGEQTPASDDATDGPAYRPISVEKPVRERFDTFVRQLEAAENRDYTHTQAVAWLLDHAPDID